jgi:hypothetical protein
VKIQIRRAININVIVFRDVTPRILVDVNILTDLINALPGNSSVNTIQHATIEEAVFSVDPTDALIDWLDSNHMFTVGPFPFCGYVSKSRGGFRAITSYE